MFFSLDAVYSNPPSGPTKENIRDASLVKAVIYLETRLCGQVASAAGAVRMLHEPQFVSPRTPSRAHQVVKQEKVTQQGFACPLGLHAYLHELTWKTAENVGSRLKTELETAVIIAKRFLLL